MLSSTRTKVLFITSKLQHYRLPIFNLISDNLNIDLTVIHSGNRIDDGNFKFKEIIVKETKVGPFSYHSDELIKYCKLSDVVVSMFYIQKLSLMRLLFFKSHFKLIYWGIGVKASQNSEFDSKSLINRIRFLVAKKSDAMLFYSDYAVNKYVNYGISGNKLFTIPNTVVVLDNRNIENVEQKKNIIFFGTMNKSKKIFDLLEAYRLCVLSGLENIPNLKIYGDGTDYNAVIEWVESNKLGHKIFVLGFIYDEMKKMLAFSEAIACISPGQAGLSVLTSFGYGVPFITHNNAITGGERLNIINDVNGKLFEHINELEEIINDITNNTKKYLEMGKNAQKFYYSQRNPTIMADSFINAVNYTLKNIR
jgi:glycosyltransferase involved in cell wall biosynthesis